MKNLYFLLLLISTISLAQDLTGRWVAVTSYNSGYYAELYLVQNSENVYAGHCYDTEKGGYCRHWLDARFDVTTQEFTGIDMELISKSEAHAPTDYILKYEKGENGKEYLTGTSAILPYHQRPYMLGIPRKDDLYNLRFRIMNSFNHVRYVKVDENYKIYDHTMPLAMTPEQILLEKAAFPEVFEEDEIASINPSIELEPSPEIEEEIEPEIPAPTEEEEEVLEVEIDKQTEEPESIVEEEEPWVTVVPETQPKEPSIIEKRHKRADRLLSHITVESEKITLLIRDYGTIDNDSVTIFYNDKIIAENLRIASDAAEFELELLPNRRNELVFVANNLGDVPPNTARITLIADKKRYNYKLFTDEQNNALILLENIKK